MKIIEKDNKIFASEKFICDKFKFSLIIQNLKEESPLIVSDEENYIIIRGKDSYPAWIWSVDCIENKKVLEIQMAIAKYFCDNLPANFTCKKELYEAFEMNGFELISNSNYYYEMGFLDMKNPVKPKACDGSMRLAGEEDIETLTRYCIADNKEIAKIHLSYNKTKESIKNKVESKTFYVWVNDKKQVVTTAFYKIYDNFARINQVYTAPEFRGKGYASNLVYELGKELISNGVTPLLYTDYNYIASNKAYKNAGFIDGGVLINFTCVKGK